MAINLNGTGSITGLSSISAPAISGVPAGTASAPAFSFTGDSNTGIYSPGADQLAISTGGSGRVFINADGLGIGVSSPTNKLQISGATANALLNGTSNSYIGCDVNSSNVGFVGDANWMFGGSSTNFGLRATNNLVFGIGLNERMRLDSSGRLGIGTTSPAGTLHLASTYPLLYLTDTDATGAARSAIGCSDGNLVYYANENNQAGGNHIFYRNGANESARLDSSGRLLVGTSSARTNFYNTAAAAALQIEGADSNAGRLSVTTNFSTATDGAAGQVVLSRSGSTTVGSNTLVANNNWLGLVSFQGADGTEFVEAAQIRAEVDGTPGANDMPGRLVFSTTADGASSPTERMRINNAGEISMGSASINSLKALTLTTGQISTGSGTLTIGTANNNTNGRYVEFQASGSVVIGSITQSSASAVAYNTSSDYRLKENIKPVTDGINRLQLLKPSRFNFISDPDKTVDGFIAHEVQTVVPEAIAGEKDAVDADGNPIYQGIDQSKLVPLLTAALQEAIGEIESLKARVAALESA